MSEIKRYAIVGLGSRSSMFSEVLLGRYSESHKLVALLDTNQSRMDFRNSQFKEKYQIAALSTYKPNQFETMIKDEKINTVIVTSIDRTHHDYIARAMYAGCDVVSEKPMTTDVEKCKVIDKAIKETGKNLRVSFNYRYSPRNSKVKELIQNGAIGNVHSVHFEWLLSTQHGADYFRRWHRDKWNSGGLMVHKATHHFDLVNWWIDSRAAEIYAQGQLAFYGRENGEKNGLYRPYYRASGSEHLKLDPFALDISEGNLKSLYKDAEHEDNYFRDLNVFGEGISIEDDMGVIIRYQNKASLSYRLTAYSPYEGYRVSFNGSKGRLELDVEENSYISGDENDANRVDVREGKDFDIEEPCRILLRQHWQKPQLIEVEEGKGGHGGGDDRMLDDIFLGKQDDPLNRSAGFEDGVKSIICGIAANQSFKTGLPVSIDDLTKDFIQL